MTNDDIIRLAVEVGIIPWTKHEFVGNGRFSFSDEGLDGDLASLIQFAGLIAEAERQECANLCEESNDMCSSYGLAQAIRARGKNETK